MTAPAPAIFVVDDDPSVLASLRSLLRSVDLTVHAFASAREFLESGRAGEPGCLVLDVRLPGTSGLELQRELVRAGIALPTIFITGHGDIPMSVAAMKAGAIEFLTKPFRDQDFLDAVHRGLDLDRTARMQAGERAEFAGRAETLSPRERQVMHLVVAGLLNKQIAHELGLSEVTVKAHRAQVMRKMQASTLPELVRIADRLAPKPAQGTDTIV